jgi:hypothetical protein
MIKYVFTGLLIVIISVLMAIFPVLAIGIVALGIVFMFLVFK